MPNLVIVRHGQSEWNLENKFTGWVDVELTEQGVQEGKAAGVLLNKEGFNKFDQAFSSVLKRANNTLGYILEGIGQEDIQITKDKDLNERHYGDLQGKNKAETAKEFGDEQVKIWRRSFDTPPPNGESLKDTAARTIPYYEKNIEPLLKEGKDILIVAHGNSLRSIMMHVEKMTKEEILETNIDTGTPRLYVFDNDLNLTEKKYI
jgi:2,3-bisphosphoglycerate-dependent phosphoglycerate mutase